MTKPTHACHGHHAPTPRDKIIEAKGPYIKMWLRLTTVVQPYLTKRDIDHMREGRTSSIFKYKDGKLLRLALINDKPKWRKAHIDPMHTHTKE